MATLEMQVNVLHLRRGGGEDSNCRWSLSKN